MRTLAWLRTWPILPVARMVQRTVAEFGGVDILINNAGMGIYGSMDEVKLADLRHVFDVNFFGAIQAMQAVVPALRRRGGGVIVNVSSIVGKFASPMGRATPPLSSRWKGQAPLPRRAKARQDQGDHRAAGADRNRVFATYLVSVPGAEHRQGERHAPMQGVTPEQVARRTVRAIRRGDREVYVTLFDRLLVLGAQMLPGIFAWALVWAAAIRRKRFEDGGIGDL
ncbi:MAG: SDR family NAD(P)-dependent oxidoreductase [Caldilineaceae bacterium]